MWDIISQVVSIGTVIGVGITVLSKLLPKYKVYMFGWNAGAFLTLVGRGKLGRPWESVENFFTDSLGYLFTGFRDGLNSDDGNGGIPPTPPKDEKFKDVRQ